MKADAMTETPQTGLCIFDEAGRLIFSNPGHTRIVGKTPLDLIGGNWKDWTPRGQMTFAADKFAQSLAGRDVAFVRIVQREDGSLVTGLAQLSAVRRRSKTIVIGSMRVMPFPYEIMNAGQADIAEYVHDFVERLKALSDQPGLAALRQSLDGVAQEAERAVRRLAKGH